MSTFKTIFYIYFSANGIVKSDKVERVMKSVDRGDFAKGHAYEDSPQLIGYGVTISAPHMVKLIYVLKLSQGTVCWGRVNLNFLAHPYGVTFLNP